MKNVLKKMNLIFVKTLRLAQLMIYCRKIIM